MMRGWGCLMRPLLPQALPAPHPHPHTPSPNLPANGTSQYVIEWGSFIFRLPPPLSVDAIEAEGD